MPNHSSAHTEFVIGALEQYEGSLTRYAMRLLSGDLDRARDVVQHTFMKLCEQDRGKIESKLAPWLYTVCRNRAIDELRESGAQTQVDASQLNAVNGTERDPMSAAQETDFHMKLQRCIDRLPKSEREVIDLWAQGFSNAEMAEIIGKSSGAIRIRLHRAIQQLKGSEEVRRWLDVDETRNQFEPPESGPSNLLTEHHHEK